MTKLPRIGCDLLRVEYDFQRQAATLYLHDGDCVDMDMAIQFVINIDKEVRTIRTVAGIEADTMYSRGIDRDWSVSVTV